MNKVILIGNPNTGKTTLFNTLTGASEHVGNWHGVTVDVRTRDILGASNLTLCDLPGLYSLDVYSPEEKISADYLIENKDCLVVNICDANNLERNLYLTNQLKEMGFNICLAVNMAKELKNYNEILSKLEGKLNVKVFPIDARKKKTCKDLLHYITSYYELNKNHKVTIKTQIIEVTEDNLKYNAKQRFLNIDRILNEIGYKTNGNYGFSKLDKVFLNKYLSIFCFILIFAIVFVITFGRIGQTLSTALGEGFNACISALFPNLQSNSSNWFIGFINDGILSGVLSVLSFLPQIMLLFLFINLLEDVGYLSRVAFMLDGSLSKLGLTGRSVFSLLMGFGCTTSAITTTRNLDNKNLRNKTALLLPNFSCSAKLPIYACICSAFFAKTKVIIVLGLYLLGVIVSLIIAFISTKLSKQNYTQSFIMEMPKLRFPSFPKIIKSVLGHAKDFLQRVGSVILAMSILVWAISNFDFKLQYVPVSGTTSIITTISSFIAPIFTPLGFGSPPIVLALLTGLIAKEMVLGVLILANGVASVGELSTSLFIATNPVSFTTASALSFLVFVLFYPACVSASSALKKELGSKLVWRSILLQFTIAYIASFITYKLAQSNISTLIAIIVVMLVLAISIKIVVKYTKRKCKENCNACTRKYNNKNCK